MCEMRNPVRRKKWYLLVKRNVHEMSYKCLIHRLNVIAGFGLAQENSHFGLFTFNFAAAKFKRVKTQVSGP